MSDDLKTNSSNQFGPDVSSNETERNRNKNSERILHAKINSKLFKNIIKIASLLSDTPQLIISPHGIEIVAINDARTAIAKFNIKKDVFEEYKSTDFRIGMDLDRVCKILEIAKPSELIDIKFNQNRNQLTIAIDELKTWMGIIDLKHNPKVNPAILNECGYALFKVDKLKRSLILSTDISESVLLGIDRTKFEVRTEQDVNAVELRMKREDLSELESKAYYENFYQSSILRDLMRCFPSESSIVIRFGDETPLQIDYDFDHEGTHLTFFLLPRIEVS